LRGDYSQRNFFPKEAHSATAIEHGLLLQSAATKHGDGRVLLYTDSTCFSNFYMFMPGKPELVLGSIDWLNRKNRFGFVKLLLAAVSIAALGAAFWVLRKEAPGKAIRIEARPLALFAVLLGIPLGVFATGRINEHSYARPAPHTNYPIIAFDAEHSNYHLPIKTFGTDSHNDIQTFYVWTQRLGVFPEVRFNFSDCLKNSDCVVVINPTREFTGREIGEFVRYVENGGKVLLLDDPRNVETSTAHQLLKPFGLKINYQAIAHAIIEDSNGVAIWGGPNSGIVAGGEPVLFVRPPGHQNHNQVVGPQPAASKENAQRESSAGPQQHSHEQIQPPGADRKFPVLSTASRGEGMIAVLANSTMFTGEAMGTTGAVPDDNRRKLYNLEYWIFRDLLKVPVQLRAKARF
jgi:hypothetical protein